MLDDSPLVAYPVATCLDIDIILADLFQQITGIAAHNLVDVGIDLDDLLVERQQSLVAFGNFPANFVYVAEVARALLAQKPHLIEPIPVPRLVQDYLGDVQLVLQLLELQGLLAFLGEALETSLLLFLEQIDGLDIILDVLALSGGSANLVIVGSHSSDVLQDGTPLVGSHRGQGRHVSLLDYVVAIGAQTGLSEDAPHIGCRGGVVIDPVGRNRGPLPAEPDRAGETDLVGVDPQSPAAIKLRGVGENERGRHVLGWPATLAAVEYQLGHICGSEGLGGLGAEDELHGI